MIVVGDCLSVLSAMPDESVHCCITSPPYWGLRAYGGDPGMIGLEPTLDEHIDRLVEVFAQVRRVLRKDGTLWLNYGDAYASQGTGAQSVNGQMASRTVSKHRGITKPLSGYKPKDLMMMPARVALALQDDGADKAACQAIGRAIAEIEAAYDPDLEQPPDKVLAVLERLEAEYMEARGDSWWLRSEIVWHKCLSGGAWLYAKTQKGQGPHMLKDLVRLDPSTVQLWNGKKWAQVVDWVQHEGESEKLELVLRSGERIGCTADHKWLTKRGLVKAQDLKIGDVLQACTLPDEGNTPAWLTNDALWFAGLYLAEGSMSGPTIQLSGHTKEVGRWERIQRLCAHYGATANLYADGNRQAIHIDQAAALHAVLSVVVAGKGARGKHLSYRVWNWSNLALLAIVEGYIEGDGSEQGGRIRLGFTRNYNLERDLRCLAARLGATLTLKPLQAKTKDRTFPAFRGEWRWDKPQHHNSKNRAEIVEIRKSRERQFWDVSVSDEPHLFALASGVLTHNSNPMPESVTDRPTSAHEKLFLFSKAPRYYYDAEAVRTAMQPQSVERLSQPTFDEQNGGSKDPKTGNRSHRKVLENLKKRGHSRPHQGFNEEWDCMTKAEQQSNGANLRNVWQIPVHAYSGAHFASFPPALVEPCIKAGTSQKGVCGKCGAPWERQIEASKGDTIGKGGWTSNNGDIAEIWVKDNDLGGYERGKTLGWQPVCTCNADTVPAVVLDPFGGAGTVALVAQRLGRKALCIEINHEYARMAQERCEKDLPLTQRPNRENPNEFKLEFSP